MKVAAIVCGLPDSGNRLVAQILQRAGALVAPVIHGDETSYEATRARVEQCINHTRARYPGEEIAFVAVCPVRHARVWRLSWEARYSRKLRHHEDVGAYARSLRQNIVRALGHFAIPEIPVSYDALILDPEVVAEELCALVGLQHVSGHLAGPDAEHRPMEARPWEGAVYDGNARWRVWERERARQPGGEE